MFTYVCSLFHVCVTTCAFHFPSRFHEAWDLCKSAGSDADWAELGKTCLLHMEVDLAIQVYRNSGNVGMVLSLQGIQVENTHSGLHAYTLNIKENASTQRSSSPLLSVPRSLQGTVNMNLLAGHLAMFLEDYNQAQNLYLSSHRPVAALEVCLCSCTLCVLEHQGLVCAFL